MNSPPILEGNNIQIRRGGKLILDVSSLEIAAGEVLSIIGPNGAGKTTLLQALSHLIRLGQGEISFQGKKVGEEITPLAYRRRLAMVFQEALLFDATVNANVAAGLKLRNIAGADIENIVQSKLEQFGIGHLRDRSAKTLSGGEAQRTSLARAFAIHPEILFLDEPFAALDPPTRESLLEDLNRIIRDSGTTAIMATHDQVEALRMSDRIAVMNEGRIIQLGAPAAVMNHPVDEFVASFVGVETIIEGKVIKHERGTATIALTARGNGAISVPSPDPPFLEAISNVQVGERVLCCLRPEHITLSSGSIHELSSARNAFPAIITRISPAGGYYKVHLQGSIPLVAYVTVQSMEDLNMREGVAVTAFFKATAVHIIRRG